MDRQRIRQINNQKIYSGKLDKYQSRASLPIPKCIPFESRPASALIPILLVLRGSRWQRYTTGDMFFQENRRGEKKLWGGVKRREIFAELAEHPPKGGYEFPLGCGQRECGGEWGQYGSCDPR